MVAGSERTQANCVAAFECGHLLCSTCDRAMQTASDHRCPVCRAPRCGMSAREAEPPPDRNVPPPARAGELWEAVMHNGLELEAMLRATRGTEQRMRFPIQPPVELSMAQHLASMGHSEPEPLVPGRQFTERMRRAIEQAISSGPSSQAAQDALWEARRTFAMMEHHPGADLLDALVNLPDADLQRWRELRRRPATSFADSLGRGSAALGYQQRPT